MAAAAAGLVVAGAELLITTTERLLTTNNAPSFKIAVVLLLSWSRGTSLTPYAECQSMEHETRLGCRRPRGRFVRVLL